MECIKSLNELDFEWGPGTGNKTESGIWVQRLHELATYKQQNNGCTNVSTLDDQNKRLGLWVATQRTQYKLLQENLQSHMTTERIKSLNELDFEWGRRTASWEQHLQELATYKQQNNGHTNVPRVFPSNKPLGLWVKTQKYQYKLLQDRKKSAMTAEHIKSLNELDFEWGHGTGNKTESGIQKRNKTESGIWEHRLQELATYKQQNNGSTTTDQMIYDMWMKYQDEIV
jgi:glutaredoxin